MNYIIWNAATFITKAKSFLTIGSGATFIWYPKVIAHVKKRQFLCLVQIKLLSTNANATISIFEFEVIQYLY